MDVYQELARDITGQLQQVFHHEINFFNASGQIIASTDPHRLGSIHEGARQVIRTGRPVYIRSDFQYIGSKTGINLPIRYEGDICAVIGITGPIEEVEPYADILHTMAEILIRERLHQNQHFSRRLNQNSLVSSLLEPSIAYPHVRQLAEALSIQLETPRYILVCKLLDPSKNFFSAHEVQALLDKYCDVLSHNFYSIGNGEVRIFLDAAYTATQCNQMIEHIGRLIQQTLSCSYTCGISEPYTSLEEASYRYEQAKLTANLLLEHQQPGYEYYAHLTRTGMFLTFLPLSEKNEVIRQVLKGTSGSQLQLIEETARSYVAHNGSIQACAEELHIHKNTFQNRLHKVWQLTGHDPRKLEDLFCLQCALKLLSYPVQVHVES